MVIENHQKTAHSPATVAKIEGIPVGGRLGDTAKAYGSAYRRLDPGRPSPTVTRSGYRDFVHPVEDRTLTVRELACLQAFPLGWGFRGTRLDSYSSRRGVPMTQFGQVGNAVPPVLAKAVAEAIRGQLACFRAGKGT